MNLLHLQYFYVVARENGYTRASRLLNVQQPAISRMVKLLEDKLGFKLFERIGRGIQLTPQGMEVFESCKRIFSEVDALSASLGRIGGELQGPLAVAAAEPIASKFLPSRIGLMVKQHPKVYPILFSGPASMLMAELLSGKIEFGIFFHLPDLPDKLEIFERLPVRFRLVIRKKLKSKRDVIESFIGSREVDDTTTRRFPTIERIRRDYPNVKIKISSNNLAAHRELVLNGLGVSILPDFLVNQDIKAGKLSELYPKEEFQFHMKFVKRKSAVLSANANTFVSSCLSREGIR